MSSKDYWEGMSYLGISEGFDTLYANMQEKIKNEVHVRVHAFLNSAINVWNKLLAINSLAVPVVIYSFKVLK